MGDAVAEMILEKLDRDCPQRGRGCGDLGQHVDAVLILIDHPLQPADLALDPAEPLEDRLLVVGVTALDHRTSPSRITPWGYPTLGTPDPCRGRRPQSAAI